MAQTDNRNVDQIRRDAERARAELTSTVQQLRDSVSDAASDVRHRFAPATLKDDLIETAARNPLQTAAVGALVAWPALRLVRSIPLPVLMIGAGLFLTGSKKGQDLSRKALDRASDLADEARRQAGELVDNAIDKASDLGERAAGIVDRVREQAQDVKQAASAAASDVAAQAAKAASDILPDPNRVEGGIEALKHTARENVADLADTARNSLDNAGETLRHAQQRAQVNVAWSADQILAWAKANPLLVAGIGMAAGGFVASALPATAAERGIAGAVSGAAKYAARQGVTAAMGVAAGAAVDLARRAAEQGLAPQSFTDVAQDYGDRAMRAAGNAADAAFGKSETSINGTTKAGA